MKIDLLDHGFVRFVEDWGRGDAGVAEAGIVEAARQSTQKNFVGFGGKYTCANCSNDVTNLSYNEVYGGCPKCLSIQVNYTPGDEKLLKYLHDHKHSTPFEFAGMVIEVCAPIMVFREWHRHRAQSYMETDFVDTLNDMGYNEMSARYAPLPDLNYIPSIERIMQDGGKNKQAQGTGRVLTREDANVFRELLETNYLQDEKLYQDALECGIPKELARLVLPVGRYSQMRATANLRCWLMFMTLRAAPDAQWEIRQFANAVGEIIAERFPRTWQIYVEGRNGV